MLRRWRVMGTSTAVTVGTYTGVAAIALLVRLLPLVQGGGLRFFGRYDDGVYYTVADALTFGRLPYKDVVLLHPPAIALVLAPFAALGRLTTDPTGMAVARLAFIGIGVLNALLVTAVARRWGWLAGVVAGVLYACWYPAVYAEQSTLLEPLQTTMLLVALLLLLRRAAPATARPYVAAGIALGIAATLKIWYVAPIAVVVGWLLVTRRWRHAGQLTAGLSGAMAAVLVPFFAAAPRKMWQMVVRDQLLRNASRTPRTTRLSSILGVHVLLVGHHDSAIAASVIAAVLLAAAVVVAATDALGLVVVALFAVALVVLLAAPSYFEHYATLTAAPAALVVGVAIGRLVSARGGGGGAVGVAAGIGVIVVALVSGGVVASRPEGRSFNADRLARRAPRGCIAADDPQLLIQMNRLSSDLAHGCRVPGDVTGITYDTLHRVGPDGRPVPRIRNQPWQRYLLDYLTSASAFVMAPHPGDELSPESWRSVERHPLLARSGSVTMRRGSALVAN